MELRNFLLVLLFKIDRYRDRIEGERGIGSKERGIGSREGGIGSREREKRRERLKMKLVASSNQ